MKSKTSLILLICVSETTGLLCTNTILGQSQLLLGSQSSGVQLSASTSKTNYAAGERIDLHLIITNGSSHDFAFETTAVPDAEYKYQIRGLKDNAEAPLTRLGTNLLLKAPQFNRFKSIRLEPGQQYTNKLVIVNQLFDVTIPQEYEVTVFRGSLRSNPVRFSVLLW